MTSKTTTLKATTLKYFSPKAFFGLFRSSLSLERNCSMTACKNPENNLTRVKRVQPVFSPHFPVSKTPAF